MKEPDAVVRPMSWLVEQVAAASRGSPDARKLLLCQTPAQGRELLRATAFAGFPWIGWEAITPRTLAHELVLLELTRTGESRADEFDLIALADIAIDLVADRGEAGPFGGMTASAGYRDAIRRTLDSLRTGGVTPEQLRRARTGDEKIRALAVMLEELERLLRERKLLDGPAIMARAAGALEQGRAMLPEGPIFVLPGLGLRGPGGRFLRALFRSERVSRLATDGVMGLPAPDSVVWEAPAQVTGTLSALHAPGAAEQHPPLDLFAAATPADELREVLRRVVSARIPWDRVEIVTTDPVTYGGALDGLARRLGIPVTYARGLDSRRTRAGRALEGYLRWIGEGFPADVLRGMLESGDLASPAGYDEVSAAALARRLRRLRVGWGRDRYLPVVEQAIASASAPGTPFDERDPEEQERWRERELTELRALRELLRRLMAATPDPGVGGVRDTGRSAGGRSAGGPAGRTSPAALAAGVQAFLRLVPHPSDEAEGAMRKVLQERLTRIRDTLTRPTAWDAAISVLRGHLVTRIAPAGERGLAPWTSTGGHLYLADLTTGGLSQRPHVFVVGMDAARVAAAGANDPLLTDGDRQAIAEVSRDPLAPIATSGERMAESRHALAAMLARLRGAITLSYSAWESAEGRSISPAPELLQALRLREGDESLTYEHLRKEMGPLAGAVPTDHRLLDGDDAWLDAIADGRVLRAGTREVRSVFRGLDAGLRARDARESEAATAWDGIIPPHPRLDPLASSTPFSASRLQTLGSCPRRYFYQYVLGIHPLRDPVHDPDVWLDALQRGSLLHAVYERTLSEARRRGIDYGDEAFESLAGEMLEEEADRELHHTPPPSQAIHDQEREELRVEVGTWVRMIREDRPDWLAVELRFGTGEREASIRAGAGEIRLRGAIDRVDRLPGGGLRIVDYKTGSANPYQERRPFAGGRRIQHVLYTLAAEHLLDEPVEVMEYHFPTRKGQQRRIRYGSGALERGAEVLETLLAMAASGHFVTTEESHDCRFCDFREVCRVKDRGWSSVDSPRATWAKEVGMELGLEPFSRLSLLRGIDE